MAGNGSSRDARVALTCFSLCPADGDFCGRLESAGIAVSPRATINELVAQQRAAADVIGFAAAAAELWDVGQYITRMKRYVTKLAQATLGVLALYLTIWPHEMGHSVAAFFFGCKTDWWRTDMSIYLWSSWAGKVDYRCLGVKGSTALATVDFAGIAVNLFLLALCPVLGRWWRGKAPPSGRAGWVLLATVWWAWANYAEAFSYLIVNTAWLTSDMKTVVEATGMSRWICFTAGVLAASAIAWLMWRPTKWAAAVLAAPQPAREWVPAVFPFYALVAAAAMSAARIVLT